MHNLWTHRPSLQLTQVCLRTLGICYLILFTFTALYGQVFIRFNDSPVQASNADQLFQLALNLQDENLRGNQVQFKGNIQHQGDIIWEGQSVIFPLNNKQIQILPGQVAWEKKNSWPDKGTYTFCLKLIQINAMREIGEACIPIVVSSKINPTFGSGKELISFHGQSRIEAQYSNIVPPFSLVPQAYMRWYINPQLQIAGVPLGGQVLLSTEDDNYRYDLNAFSFALDPSELANQLKARALEELNAPFSGGDDIRTKLEAIKHTRIQEYLSQFPPSVR